MSKAKKATFTEALTNTCKEAAENGKEYVQTCISGKCVKKRKPYYIVCMCKHTEIYCTL